MSGAGRREGPVWVGEDWQLHAVHTLNLDGSGVLSGAAKYTCLPSTHYTDSY